MRYCLSFGIIGFWLLTQVVVAQIPDYYQGVDLSLEGAELQEQLTQLVVSTHFTELSYSPGVWDALKLTDLDPENEEKVLLIYGFNDSDGNFTTDRSRGVDENCSTSDCTGFWNREHVFSRSQAEPSMDLFGPGTDVHNLRASDSKMNERRANRRFAEGNGNADITPQGDFYPGDEWKGDVARMIMYMYIRYEDRCFPAFAAVGTQFYDPEGIMVDVLLDWNSEDPVSEIELQRNEVLEDLQGNRNPFIDNPYLATLIWEGPAAEDRWMISHTADQQFNEIFLYPTATRDFIYIAHDSDDHYEYRILNITGQQLNSGTTMGKIDLSNNAPSWYFIEIQNGKSHSTHRILRQ